jgi:hypothetical protein
MDNIERDFEYDQKIEDIADKLELLILKAMSHVLDNLMQAYWHDDDNNNNTQDQPWPF